jgi:hypothetical protein
MRPLTTEQLIQQLQLVIKHLRCPGENHDMLRIMLAWAQLGTGMSFSLLECPEKPVAHLECEWVQSIRTGLAKIRGRIERTKETVFKPRRMDDLHIMDKICNCKRFTDTQIRKINACRLYLQVTLLSEITTPCGKHIETAYYQGALIDRTNWPTVQYPRQENPDKTSWALWRRALHLNHVRDDKKTLLVPLKQWQLAESYHNQWKWNYTTDELFRQDAKTEHIIRYPLQKSGRRHFRFSKDGTPALSVPLESIPVNPTQSKQHHNCTYRGSTHRNHYRYETTTPG